jgi:hypothetical protein
MKNVQGIKMGNVVNISLNGKLHKKNCGSPQEADELFKLVLKAKDDPSDENIKAIRSYLNDNVRVAMLAGLENDPDTGEVFLAGFNTPIPTTLVEVIKEYWENSYPLEAIINFWKLLMINPDVRVRKSLFDFISTHDFVLTDKGYMVVYKAVYNSKEEKKSDLGEFVSNQYLHVKKDWSCSPNKYTVYRDLESNALAITKNATAEGWGEEVNVEIIGKLGDVYNNIFDNGEAENENVPVYTDMHTQTMRIVLGAPTIMERKNCDSDPAVDCSYGLHCGATKYVERFAGGTGVVLACYVNPANVVAVPQYDHSKMRVSEYFPFAVATYKDKKIDIVEQKYFESDYQSHEEAEVKKLIAKVKKAEKPIEKAINAEEEVRPMSELQKILETRLLDLSV